MNSTALRGALVAAFLLVAAVACGGGGSSTTPSAPGIQSGPSPQPSPSVSGDMLAYQSGRGWNYSLIANGQPLTISLYADPSPAPSSSPGSVTPEVLVGAGVAGNVPTVLTSVANVDANLLGALGLNSVLGTYSVVAESSAGGSYVVPGSPVLVNGTLTLNQTWVPGPGATATVVAIGSMPNESACPPPSNTATGAQVRYQYPGYDDTIAYVPGCGITDLKNDGSGAEMMLTSVGDYSSLGSLSSVRHVARTSWLDSAFSLMGLNHRASPHAASVLGMFLKTR